MAWSFTNLKYGWRYVVGISLAATTIYVANNTRWRINQADDIELDLAVAERCLATQYGTNAAGEPLYRVVPPEYVRSWYSNSYVTTNVPGDAVTNWTAQLHTNIYTNTVGWRTDRAKAVSRDAKIKALCPYYVDTDSVYDGTTNIIMHTFTGLLTSLDLGDHTNFTAIPAIGTNVATYGPWAWRNYVVAWQERYKVLNALKMSFKQTADEGDLRKVRLVTQNFYGRYKIVYSNTTSGDLWTNRYPTTGSPYPGIPIYPEFYWPGESVSANTNASGCVELSRTYTPLTWGEIKTGMEEFWTYGSITGGTDVIIITNGDSYYTPLNYSHAEIDASTWGTNPPETILYNWYVALWKRRARWKWFVSTNISCDYGLYFRGIIPYGIFDYAYSNSYEYNNTLSAGAGTGTNSFTDLTSFSTLSNTWIFIDFDTSDPIAESSTVPTWCDEPTTWGHVETNWYGGLFWKVDGYLYQTKGGGFYDGLVGEDVGGPNPPGWNTYATFDWEFLYCTDKYW